MSSDVCVTVSSSDLGDADDEGGDSEGPRGALDLEGSIVVGPIARRCSNCSHSSRSSSSSSCSSCSSCSSSRGYSATRSTPEEGEDDGEELPFPGFRPVTLFCLSQTSHPRDWCLRMVNNPWFERMCMAVILLNCVTLGMYRPCADDVCDSPRCRVLQHFDDLIFGFFALEMLVKITAMGAFGKNAYLAETWNRLDFFIVVAGSLEYCLDVGNINLSAIRTVRVLRPLRAINRIPSMRILVMLLLDTLPMLGNVLLLCFFVFFIFGIVGVQLWAGLLRQRCFIELPPNTSLPKYISPYYYERIKVLNPVSTYYQSPEADKDYICSLDKDHGVHRCSGLPNARFGGRPCNGSAQPFSDNAPETDHCVNWNQYYTLCRPGDRNPFQGAISFDNIGLAWVAIFLVISLEGWTDIMYYVQDAHSFWDFTYFVLLIVVGSFFMINLCLVVIATQFSETKKREMERMRLERARFRSSSTLASGSEPGGCYSQLFRLAVRALRRGRRRLLKALPPCRPPRRKKHPKPPPPPPPSTLPHAPFASPEISDVDLVASPRDGDKRNECLRSDVRPGSRASQLTCAELLAITATQGAVLAGNAFAMQHIYSNLERGEKPLSAPQLLFYPGDDSWSDSEVSEPLCRWWGSTRARVKSFTDHRYFQRGILTAILVNTLSMGIEYHNQPDELTLAVEISNVVFTAVFCLEMVLKMFAEGFCSYISSGFNVFDSVIVVLSLVELCQSSGGGGGSSGLSVLRTFRLLRILKLVRFLPALRRQLIIMLRTVDNVAVFFALLILFIFIFSILGMNLFGCKFCRKLPDGGTQCDRKNFDSLLWAIVTVFQILTQEDWNVVLFNGMEKTSHWAALYFVALMTFGNYVLFNLLVAILVEGFSAEDDKRESETRSNCSLCEKQECETSTDKENTTDTGGKWIREEEDPKDNIEKEIKMKAYPYVLRVLKQEGNGGGNLCFPPVITHTAATPQGSPSATLVTHDKTPVSPVESFPAVFQVASLNIPSLGSQPDSRRSSVIVALSRQSSIISNISRKNSLGPCFSLQARGSFSSWRRKRSENESSENGSGSEDVVLNNMACQPNSQPCENHTHCNGSIPTLLQNTPNNKRQQPLSPQHSVRSLSRHTSLSSSFRNDLAPPPLHKPAEYDLPLKEYRSPRFVSYQPQCPHRRQEEGFQELLEYWSDSDSGRVFKICFQQLCWFIEPKGWIKERKDYSLFLFSKSHCLRRACTRLSENKWFDYTILVFIASNCVTLAMERPTIPPDSLERAFLAFANYTFTIVFTFEMAVKVLSKGLWYGPSAYFKSGWNVMDGFVVGISLVDLLLSLVAESSPRIFGILRVFRLLRSLRPLRVINRAPGLKLVVQTLLSSLRPIGNIVLICCTFFIIFGILGVQLFKGSMYYCEGPTASRVRNKFECLQDPRNLWLNRKYNFDNLGQALMSLFVLSSKDGWVNIMYTGLDAVGVDQQPIENYNEWRLLYFISFLLLVAFFVLNMFVGVVVENFHRCREQQEREEKARRAAKRAKKMDKKRRKMREPPYYINYSRPRLLIHSVITSKYFDLAIAAVIGLNVVTMAMEFYMMPKKLEYALKVFNYFFTAVFIVEACMKIVALGIFKYLKNRWNQLDIMIVGLSIAGIVLEKMESDLIPINPTIIRVFRVLRIARVLKLLKMAKGIRALLDTVMQALPQVGNLGLLFFLLFFIFAALGVELFGRLECTEDLPCEGLGEHAHFKDFGMAFLTLFRVATGDNWNGIMKDTLRENCDYSSDCVRNCCVSAIVAPLYFVVFVLMAQFVLVNVVVAVLMKHLEESHKQMDDDIEMDAELERELAAEVRGEQLAAARAAEEEKLNRSGQTKPTTHRPLVKMASLPPNFVFPFNNAEERSFRRASLNILNSGGGGGRLSTSNFSMPLAPNINIRQASPDEADSKVSVANLSPVPLRSPLADPPDADWACVFASLGDPCHVQLLGDGRLLLDVGRRRSTDAPRHHARTPDRRLSADERRWLRADGPEASAGNVRRWLSAEDEAKSAAESGRRDSSSRSAEAGPRRWLSAEPNNVDAVGSGNGNSSRSAEAGHRRCFSAEPDNVDVVGSAGGGSRDSNKSAETGHRIWLSAEPDNVLIVRSAEGDCRVSRKSSEAGQRNASRWLSAESDKADVVRSADKGNRNSNRGTEGDVRDARKSVEAGQRNVRQWLSAEPDMDSAEVGKRETRRSPEGGNREDGRSAEGDQRNGNRWLSVEPDHRDSIKSPEGGSADADGGLSSEIDRSGEGIKRSSAESGVTKWLSVEPHSRDFSRSIRAERGNRESDRKPSAEVTVSNWLSVEPDVCKSSEVDHRDINVSLNTEKDGRTAWLSVEPDVRDLNRRWSAEVDNRNSSMEFDNRDNFLKLSVEEGNREVHRRLSAETGAQETTGKSSAETCIQKVDSGPYLDDKKVSKANQADSVSQRTLPRTSSNSGCSNEQRPPQPERVASSDSGDCFHGDDSPLIRSHLRRRLGSSSLSYNEGTDSTDC